MDAGVGVVYGYSQSVTFIGDYCFEEEFFNELLQGGTVAESIRTTQAPHGNWDCSPAILGSDSSQTAASLEEAVRLFPEDEEVFVIGGAQIYAEALPLADRFYLTRVRHSYEGDTRFPAWDESEWRAVSSESFPCGKDYPWPFVFELYERR